MDGISDHCNFNLKAVFNVTPKTKNKKVLINLSCTTVPRGEKRERKGRGGEREGERERGGERGGKRGREKESERERERERERGEREREREGERKRERGGERVNISNHLP